MGMLARVSLWEMEARGVGDRLFPLAVRPAILALARGMDGFLLDPRGMGEV